MASRKCANCKKWLAAGQYTCRYCNRGEEDLRLDLKKANLAKLRACFAGTGDKLDEQAMILLLAPYAAGEALPETLCGEAVAWGESVALIEALVKKGCARVGAEALGKHLASLKRREVEAVELEQQLLVQQEAMRKKALAGGEVAEMEREQLAAARAAIAALRTVSVLERTLAVCKVEECAELHEARALLARLEQAKKEKLPAPEVVQARPAKERETFEQTSETVGVNECVQALKTRDLESSQDERDEWCGDELAEGEEHVLVAEITVADGVVKLSGSLVPFVKSASFSFGVSPGATMTKMGGSFSGKIGPAFDPRHQLVVTMEVCWFPKLKFQHYAVEKFAVGVADTARGRLTRIAFPAPFKKPTGLVDECIGVMQNPAAGTAVMHDLLLGRLNSAMQRLMAGAEAMQNWRHLCTIFCAQRAFCGMLNLSVEFAEPDQARRLLYVSPNSLSFGIAEHFLANTDRFLRPGLNWHAVRQGSWGGPIFTPEFDAALAAEALNAAVTVPKSASVVSEQLKGVLQHWCDTALTPAIFPHLQGGFNGLLVLSVNLRLASSSVNAPLVGNYDLLLEYCCQQSDFSQVSQLLAFAMGRHKRLGENSCVQWLPKDILRYIARLLKPDDSCTDRVRRDFGGRRRPVLMRQGVGVICTRGAGMREAACLRPPRAVHLFASFVGCASFPRFLELPDLAMGNVLRHLSLKDILLLQRTSKVVYALVMRLADFELLCEVEHYNKKTKRSNAEWRREAVANSNSYSVFAPGRLQWRETKYLPQRDSVCLMQ